MQCPTQCHARYLHGRRGLPLKIPPAAELSKVDRKFQTLNNLEPIPPTMKRLPSPLCMPPKSIRLIDKQTAVRRNPRHNHNVARGLT